GLNKRNNMPFTCPVCGFSALVQPARTHEGGGSQEICPSCGIQFGYDDEAGGDLSARQMIYGEWRRRWIAGGMRWDNGRTTPPADWDPKEQLRRIGIST